MPVFRFYAFCTLCLLCSLVLASCSPDNSTPAQPNRVTQTLSDTPNYNNGRVSLVFDSRDVAHMIVGGDHLYHFSRHPNGWHAQGNLVGGKGARRRSMDI